MAEGSPTVRRRELGTLLRALRAGQGLTVEQVAERLLCSPSKVSRMETGHRGATQRDVRDLCDLYGVTDDDERARLMSLAREGKQQSWWQTYDLPFPFTTYVGLEADAVSIYNYDSAVVPGLLQTAEYARALYEVAPPQRSVPELTPEVIDQRVEARLKRQEILARKDRPLSFHTVLDEAALHRVIGSPGIMAAQLRRLARASRLPNVTVQIIPFTAGAHPALDSNFSLLNFREPVPSVVYVEGLVGWIYLERAEDLDRYRQVFERLTAIALPPDRSAELITTLGRSFRDG